MQIFKKLFARIKQKGFVSALDIFLMEYDAKNPKKSLSQHQEIKKFKRIFRLRDNPKPAEVEKNKLWEGF